MTISAMLRDTDNNSPDEIASTWNWQLALFPPTCNPLKWGRNASKPHINVLSSLRIKRNPNIKMKKKKKGIQQISFAYD